MHAISHLKSWFLAVRTYICLVVILNGSLAQAGKFKPDPADPAVMNPAGILLGSGTVYHRKPIGTINEPDLKVKLHTPYHGELSIQRKSLRLLLFKSTADKHQHDRMALDMNGDGLLTENDILDISKPKQEITLELDAFSTVKCILTATRVQKGRNPYTEVSLFPTTCLKGSIRLGDKDLLAYLYDSNRDGQTGMGDTLLIDVNNDGKIDKPNKPYRQQEQEVFVLNKCLYISGMFRSPVLATKHKQVSVDMAPYKGATGSLTIDGDLLGSLTNATMKVNISPRQLENVQIATVPLSVKANEPVKLPVGTYQMNYGTLQGTEGVASFRLSKLLTIKNDETIKLTFTKPEIAIKVSQQGHVIKVHRDIKAKHDVAYRFFSASAGSKAPKADPPKVEVFVKGGNGLAIGSGKMGYG
jgi:hypothetical protein